MPLQRWRMIQLGLLHLENCIVKATHASQQDLQQKKNRGPPSSQKKNSEVFMACFKCTSKTMGTCNRALSWNTLPGCRKQSIARKQKNMRKELSPALNVFPPFLSGPVRSAARGPRHLCISAWQGDPCLTSQDTSKNPPSPSGEPGLVMPRPCHIDCSFRPGEKLRKKQKS